MTNTGDKGTVITEGLLTRLEQQLEWLEIVHVTEEGFSDDAG